MSANFIVGWVPTLHLAWDAATCSQCIWPCHGEKTAPPSSCQCYAYVMVTLFAACQCVCVCVLSTIVGHLLVLLATNMCLMVVFLPIRCFGNSVSPLAVVLCPGCAMVLAGTPPLQIWKAELSTYYSSKQMSLHLVLPGLPALLTYAWSQW